MKAPVPIRPAMILLVILLLVLPFLSARAAVNTVSAPGAASDSSPVTGLIVPLYGQLGNGSQLGGEWSQLIQARQDYPGVPIVAIVNPANGSGKAEDPAYASAIEELRGTGVVVLGYVSTLQAQIPILDVEAQVAHYKDWYGVNGAYFDQMPQHQGNESYYAALTGFAKSLGMTMTMGNPGAPTSLSYVGTVDTLVVYENGTAPSLSYLSSWDRAGYGKENFAFIASEVPGLNRTYIDAAAASVGFMFISDSAVYFVLPTYFSDEISLLQSLAPRAHDPSSLGSPTINAVLEVGGALAVGGAVLALWARRTRERRWKNDHARRAPDGA